MKLWIAPALLALAAPARTGSDEGRHERAPSFAPTVQAPAAESALERARALEKSRDWTALVDFLTERAKRVELGPDEERLYATALEQLGRMDEAAHHLELGATGFERAGRDFEVKSAVATLRRVDPLSARRDPFVRKVSTTLITAVEELIEGGDAERALRVAESLPRIARGKEARAASELLARARSAFQKVELTDPDAAKGAGATVLPLVERETEHYRLYCHLEPDVVERLGKLMDDVHAFYVRVYFDGDAKRARGAKAKIHIAPDKKTMLEGWQGTTGPEGWWSPGENAVHAYDTRNSEWKTLDWMLETLFHEASHQFMSLLAGSSSVPAWLNEGTSSFFEGTVAMADGRVLWPRAAEKRLESLVFQMANGKPPTLRDVVLYDQPGSYGAEYYAWGWGLVYFFQEYEDPTTLEHVYRPLYARYRDAVIRQGRGSFELFEKSFCGDVSPQKLPDFSSFEREWRRWMLEEVAPLHGTNAKAREMRLARIDRLIGAANAVKEKKKSAPTPEELLTRALVHLEWVRTRIDADKPDGALLLRQIEVFERLGRPTSAAALIEDLLDLADEGEYALDDETRGMLEKRLAKLDRRNAALRTAKRRVGELSRSALALVEDYRDAGLTLRASTLAADLAAVLGDRLEPVAAELRNEARAKGLLTGSIRGFAPNVEAWAPISAVPMEAFQPAAGSTTLASVRGSQMVDTTIDARGEYVVRATIERVGAREPGSAVGLVVAGTPERATTMVALDDRGQVGIWTVPAASRGSGTLRRTRTMAVTPPVGADEVVALAVRVRVDGSMDIRVGDRPPVDARLEAAPERTRHVGIFVKNARARFVDPLVELMP